MKIERTVDELGRIVLPKEVRQELNIKEKDTLFVTVENGKIILSPVEKN